MAFEDVRDRWRLTPVTLATMATLVALAVVAGVMAWGPVSRKLNPGGPEPQLGADQHPAPPLAVANDGPRGSLEFAGAGADGIVPGPEVEVTVTPPPGATQMQIGFDPTFAVGLWRPLAPTVTLRSVNQGYQMVFARFRSQPGGAVSPVTVAGITIDATWDAATASAQGKHRASWVRPLSPDLVVMRIEAGRLVRGRQQPYDFAKPPAGDKVTNLFGLEKLKQVSRGGTPYGAQVSGHTDLLKTYDRLAGKPLDAAALLGGKWTITSSDDPAYATPQAPTGFGRSARPDGNGSGAGGQPVVPLVHDISLALPHPLQAGKHYRINPPANLVEPYDLALEPQLISPSVHVNENGYAPGDPVKVGYLSGPLPAELPAGADPGYRAGVPFQVLEAGGGRVAARGQTTARPGGAEMGQGDLTGTPVFELDFSSLTQAGRYQACVDGVGCSVPFSVGNDVWSSLAVTVARAMYQQRSGTALGPPFTSVARARPFHPDDGKVVQDDSLPLLAVSDTSEVFDRLVAGQKPGTVNGAWGGHFDAGDWDRRIEHLWYTRAAAELVQQQPDRWGKIDLNIPESGDGVPDVLDEGLWSLDLYKRMQGPDGSIRGGVETSSHPRADSTSWSDNLATFAYAPDPYASYLYAGVAAEVSVVLRPYDEARAAGYLTSAQAAMTWAEAQPPNPDPNKAALVAGQRQVAAAALLEATGDRHWDEVFRASSTLDDGVDSALACHAHTACDAGWIYWMTDPAVTDPAVRAQIGRSFTASADAVLAAANTTAFGWTAEDPKVPLIWGLGTGGAPKVTVLLRAWAVSGDQRYRDAALRSAAVTLGANPLGTVFITGVGQNPVRQPLIVDVANGGLPVWAGIPVYGPHRVGEADPWVDRDILGPAGVTPLAGQVPYLWSWYDVSNVAQFNEFTVFQSHAQALYAFGLLSG